MLGPEHGPPRARSEEPVRLHRECEEAGDPVASGSRFWGARRPGCPSGTRNGMSRGHARRARARAPEDPVGHVKGANHQTGSTRGRAARGVMQGRGGGGGGGGPPRGYLRHPGRRVERVPHASAVLGRRWGSSTSPFYFDSSAPAGPVKGPGWGSSASAKHGGEGGQRTPLGGGRLSRLVLGDSGTPRPAEVIAGTGR